ncbi:MAG: response regulator [Nitrospinota bacterium]|nr:MAG: response regulator [Nitrospinota bacterium]
MRKNRWTFFQNRSLQAKMLVIILPLVIVPMLILAAVGFVTSSREAAKTSLRYLKQRENDLRTIAETPSIPNYFINTAYGLVEEAEVYRQELENALERFADRSNSIELVYAQVRYVDQQGQEIAKVVRGQIGTEYGQVAESPFFAAVQRLGPDEVYLSPLGPQMTYAMPVFHPDRGTFQGAVVLDFVYPLHDFRHTTIVIGRTFLIITVLSLGIALFVTINRVQRLTDPIRRLAEAANLIATGQRAVQVEIHTQDEIGRLAHAFNAMATSLEQNEAALRRKIVETRTLYEIGQEIIAQVDLEPTLHLIVEQAHALLQVEGSLLALRQEGSDTYLIQAHSGTIPASLARLQIRPGEGLGGQVILTGKPIMVGDYLTEYGDSPFFSIVQEAGFRSALAVPLKAHDSVIGILYVASQIPHKFQAEDQELLNALADQAAIAIENAQLYQQVRKHAAELEAKVRERTQELEEVNRRLAVTSQHKSEFLANMSHELRTPMNAIIGFTRLVMRRAKDVLPQRQYENLEKILLSAEHLLQLINDILDLSKIEAGRMEVQPASFALDALIEECLRTVEPMRRSERIQLVKSLEAALPPLFTDQAKLKQILMNLLSNAVKFTEDGCITVTAHPHGGDLVIAVADTGIGIPADKLEVIFEEFRQVDSSTTRKYGGTGLGLSISRRLAQLLGGNITVQSTVGSGSTFTVTLPLHYGTIQPVMPAPPPDRLTTLPEAGRVVLVIDDDPDVIYLLQENLAEAGYRVVGITNGEEGLQKARELRPFAIILDLLMPQKDGWQILHELKADEVTRPIPIIVLSIIDNRELGYRLGAADYLLKPFDREAILAALARLAPQPGHLLLVDDDPQLLDLVRQLLEGTPYAIETARDGEEALEAITRHTPAVILLDLLMPRMDGFAVIEYLQQDPRYREIPVIVLTAKVLTDAEKHLLQQRVQTIIQKNGLHRQTLLQELQRVLQSYQR